MGPVELNYFLSLLACCILSFSFLLFVHVLFLLFVFLLWYNFVSVLQKLEREAHFGWGDIASVFVSYVFLVLLVGFLIYVWDLMGIPRELFESVVRDIDEKSKGVMCISSDWANKLGCCGEIGGGEVLVRYVNVLLMVVNFILKMALLLTIAVIPFWFGWKRFRRLYLIREVHIGYVGIQVMISFIAVMVLVIILFLVKEKLLGLDVIGMIKSLKECIR